MAANGHHWIPDAGCAPHYCIFPEQETWHKQTISHNTIQVNGKSQAKATGRCVLWHMTPELDATTVMTDSCYPGVQHYRTIIHPRQGYFLIYDRVSSEDEAQLEWLLHVNGTPKQQQAGERIFSHDSLRLQVLYDPAGVELSEMKQGLVGGFDRHLWKGDSYPEKGQPGWRYIPYFSLDRTAPSRETVTYVAVLSSFSSEQEKLMLETREEGDYMRVIVSGEMGVDVILLPADISQYSDERIQFRHRDAETEWEQIIK